MLSQQDILIRIVVAALLGATVGLERERKNWTAGMRTHMMVCVGSSLFMMVSAFGFSDILGSDHVSLDPSRVAAQVVSGIGFIGAGTIVFLRQGIIRGLTTASGMWTVAAIGLATGGGMYFAAVVTTVVALTILYAVQPLEAVIARRYVKRTLFISLKADTDAAEIVREVSAMEKVNISGFQLSKNDTSWSLELKFTDLKPETVLEITHAMQSNPQLKELYWGK
ncbi:putative Mg2+ transporter-C (MgtC) family protein [bacterium A37T11]|nr:putative Mg2+ transporter-C (MgtC) family protein [bacterium A37T11]